MYGSEQRMSSVCALQRAYVHALLHRALAFKCRVENPTVYIGGYLLEHSGSCRGRILVATFCSFNTTVGRGHNKYVGPNGESTYYEMPKQQME